MTTTMIWICHAPTAALRKGAFPKDEPIDPRGAAQCAAMAPRLSRPDHCWCAPELRSRETASAFGLDPGMEPALRDCDYGKWRGRDLREIEAQEPEALARWIRDPQAAPHGGESFADVLDRVVAWMTERESESGQSIVVASAAVIRAAALHALGAGIQFHGRIDIGPLSQAMITYNGREWRLKALNLHPDEWIGIE
ncbi:MAG TPA: phosphoglycerate mutase family protein [Dongiaceae bacterium]|jgi:broad specificity phosphatase PhoE